MKSSRVQALAWSVLLFLAATLATPAVARELAFEDRVRAQEAIEGVYYGHQIGATKPFDQAVPRAVIEEKVRRQLRQSVALESRWHTRVTTTMLERELARMVGGTQMPERLRQLFEALGNDPFLVQECLARPVLVDRLSRSFFASDDRIHGVARKEAASLRSLLLSGDLDPSAEHPRREAVARQLEGEPRAQDTLAVGEIGTLVEEGNHLYVRVGLDDSRVVQYSVPKRSWDSWWAEVSPALDESGVEAVASSDWPRGVNVPSGGGPVVPCLPDDTWDNGILDDVVGRIGATSVWTGSEMIVWGGDIGEPVLDHFRDSGSRYDPATDTWSSTSYAGGPSARVDHTAVWTGTEMIVWGGTGLSEEGVDYFDTGGRYDPASDTWIPISAVGAPQPRDRHTAVWTGSEMIVWGGWTEGAIPLGTGGRYDPATDTWTPMSAVNAPAARVRHTAIWTGARMIVWGGAVNLGGSSHATGGLYDPVSDAWTPTSMVQSPTARADHTAVWTGSRMIVWGGVGGSNTGGRYDPIADSWSAATTDGAPSPRSGHTAVWNGSSMIVWGGEWGAERGSLPSRDEHLASDHDRQCSPGTGGPLCGLDGGCDGRVGRGVLLGGGALGPDLPTTGGRYDPSTDSWTPTSMTAPEKRFRHSSVWTGSLIVVWGGTGYSGDLDTGGRYDPATDSWSPTSLSNAPSKRIFHTAVWTGQLMVIWGGDASAPQCELGTGSRYDPVADTWSPTSTFHAPEPRQLAVAVWTGSRMILWGGSRSSGSSCGSTQYLATGRSYDPDADEWAPLSATGAPPARREATAEWTGSEMIVWGGDGPSGETNTGGRYDPAENTWSSTSTVGAPSPRYRHGMVWTGSEVIVWGGTATPGGSADFLDTGGRYDPETDTWTATSMVDAPFERQSPKVVWTGSEMLVWGGYLLPDWVSGGRYDPQSDSWSPISKFAAPPSLDAGTAVWTGSSMIVWGGYEANSGNWGGRYAIGRSHDGDGDGFTECQGDCNDLNASMRPGLAESCDGLDNNCSSGIDEAAEPPEIAELGFTSASELSWQPGPAGFGAIHDVARGVVHELPVGAGAGEMCLASEAGSTTFDTELPDGGTAYWYLVRGRNDCGIGTYGEDSGGSERNSPVCP